MLESNHQYSKHTKGRTHVKIQKKIIAKSQKRNPDATPEPAAKKPRQRSGLDVFNITLYTSDTSDTPDTNAPNLIEQFTSWLTTEPHRGAGRNGFWGGVNSNF
jgi:hypothetical protein